MSRPSTLLLIAALTALISIPLDAQAKKSWAPAKDWIQLKLKVFFRAECKIFAIERSLNHYGVVSG